MSNDLITRLRQHRYNTWNDDLGPEPDKALAADLIEELEAKLAKAVETLREIEADSPSHGAIKYTIRTVLAEL